MHIANSKFFYRFYAKKDASPKYSTNPIASGIDVLKCPNDVK